MSQSKAEQIIQKAVELISLPPLVYCGVGQVYRSLNHALAQDQLPCIVLTRGPGSRPEQATIAQLDRSVWLHVHALACGNAAETDADAAINEVHQRLYADRTLGGLALDISEGEEGADTEEINTDICRITKSYLIEYRTGTESLET